MILFNEELLELQIIEFCETIKNKDNDGTISDILKKMRTEKINYEYSAELDIDKLNEDNLEKLKKMIVTKIKDSNKKNKVDFYKIVNDHSLIAYVPITRNDIVKKIMERELEEEYFYEKEIRKGFKINVEVISVNTNNISALDDMIINELSEI